MYGKLRLNKKGISEQIATVLLIGFVIALLVFVILWGRNYIQEKAEKQGKLAEKQLECENIQLEVVNSYKQADEIVVTLKNAKNKAIEKFTFRVGIQGFATSSFDKLDSLSIRQYVVKPAESIENINSIDIIPWLKVAKGYYVPCSAKHIEAFILSQ
nr:hypothetical protein [Candidatus Woesearchaeota archaeon]